MPKNPVSDPLTDQEIAFDRLILSGTMNDHNAAETAGFNPCSAAYTQATPRVHDDMSEHRTAANEKPISQEAEGLRNLDIGREQILARLWQLANLSHEVTRGSVTGQIKALSMIIAIEGLIPDRRLSRVSAQPASLPTKPNIYVSEPMRRRRQAEGAEPGKAVTAAETQTTAPQAPRPPSPEPPSAPQSPTQTDNAPSPNPNRNPTSPNNSSLFPKGMNWVPEVMGRVYNADLDASGPLRLPTPPWKNTSARSREIL